MSTPVTRGDQTKFRIMQAAIQLSRNTHYTKITVNEIVDLASMSVGTLHYHYDSIHSLRFEMMKHCIDFNIYEIIAQGIADKHPLCNELSDDVKRKAVNTLIA